MQIWVVECELEGEVISLHRSRETAMERAEEYMTEHQGQFTGEGYKGWTPIKDYRPTGDMKIYFRTPHNGYDMYVYALDLND